MACFLTFWPKWVKIPKFGALITFSGWGITRGSWIPFLNLIGRWFQKCFPLFPSPLVSWTLGGLNFTYICPFSHPLWSTIIWTCNKFQLWGPQVVGYTSHGPRVPIPFLFPILYPTFLQNIIWTHTSCTKSYKFTKSGSQWLAPKGGGVRRLNSHGVYEDLIRLLYLALKFLKIVGVSRAPPWVSLN